MKIGSRDAISEPSAKIGVQPQNLLYIKGIGGDQPLPAWIAPLRLQPLNVLVAGDIRVLAVDALAGPVRHPRGRLLQKLRRPKRIRQQDQ